MKPLGSACLLATAASLSLGLPGLPARAAVPVDTLTLRDAVTVDGVRAHQAALQVIADANGGIRSSGTAGYDASVDYVVDQLESTGYFEVTEQPFNFLSAVVLGPSILEQVAPTAVTYTEGTDYDPFDQTDPGDVTAPMTAVDLDFGPLGDGFDNTSTSGCESADFTGFPVGNIALLQRGTCTFQLKAENAADAGAAGAIIFNQGNTAERRGLISGTLSADYQGGIPVFEATYALGETLAGISGVELHMFANVFRGMVTTKNVIAETLEGRDDRVVLVGAHLDSVPEGPGIQDNGSGSAAILEIALQMAELGIEPRNKVRFAWWGAEESGLVGSQYYVDQLSKKQRQDIALNLNFDMIGSPNFVRFVYDGDGSATPVKGPTGSKNIEQIFLDYFADEGLATEPTAFDGRSDYGPFIAVGIPAGGLFTGAEGIKTPEEATLYGGTAGIQYDPCYHLACDTFLNISVEALGQMSDAAAHAVLTFAETTSAVSGTARGEARGKFALEELEFRGRHLQK